MASRVIIMPNTVRTVRCLMVLVLAFAISGCAGLAGREATSDTFELGLSDPSDVGAVRRGVQILIAEPTALKALDSENIVIRTEPLVVQYLDDAQWSDRLPKLVQARLADAFTATDRFAGVGLPGQGLAIDYQLISEVRSFSIDARSNVANVVITAKLLDDRDGDVVASRRFSQSVRVTSTDSRAFVTALDAAFGSVTADIVRWVAGRI